MRRSIRVKLIFGVITIITIPLLCIFCIIAYNIVNLSSNNYLTASNDALKRTSTAISLFLDEAKANMNHLAAYPDVRAIDASLTDFLQAKGKVPTLPRPDDSLGQRLQQWCRLLKHSHPHYRKVYLGSRYGGFVNSSDKPRGSYDPRKRTWYKGATATPDQAIVSAPFRSTDGQATISAARAFTDAAGQVLGVVSADISLSVITDMVDTIRPGRTGFVLVAEKGGVIIANTLHPQWSLKPLTDLDDNVLAGLFSGATGKVEFDFEHETYVANVFDAPDLGWRFVSCIRKSELMEPARRTVTAIAWVALASLVLIIAVLWLYMNTSVIRPLSRVGMFLKAMSAGDYETRLETGRRGDEIAAIFDALNAMAARLGATIADVRAKSREAEEKALACQAATDKAEEASRQAILAKKEGMLQAANRLETVIDVVSSASTDLSEQMEQATRSCEEQARRVEETASAMEEMNATVLEVAKSAAVAASTSAEAREKAEEGTATMDRVASAMERVRSDARQSREQMNALAKQAENIGQVLGIISDIADQTNLLALNAAIEAARAGEAGRGFAVVADEVRKLAEKTMLATKEVHTTTRGIQDGARQSCEAVDKAATVIEETAGLAGEAGGVLRRIMEFVDSTADQVRSIATASEQQSATSDEINHSVGEIRALASDTAGTMRHSIDAVATLREQVADLSTLIAAMQGTDQA